MYRTRLLLQRTWQEFGIDNCSQMAAAIAYYVLFAIVPLTMFLVSVTSVAAGEEGRDNAIEWVEGHIDVTPQEVSIVLTDDALGSLTSRYGADAAMEVQDELADINDSEDRVAERRALAESIEGQQAITVAGYDLKPDELEVRSESFIGDVIRGAAAAAVPLGLASFVALAFSASIAFSAVRRALNFVWGVPHRPFAQQRMMELAMLFGLVVLFGSSVTTTAVAQVIRDANQGAQNPIASSSGALWLAFGYVLPWAFTFALVLLAYRFVPNAANSVRDVWPGAVVASVGIEGLKYGYGVYVVNFGSYGAAYGALAGILLFMFFVWLASYVFLMGAELASEYPKVMRGEYAAEESPREPGRGLRNTILEAVRGLFVRGQGG